MINHTLKLFFEKVINFIKPRILRLIILGTIILLASSIIIIERNQSNTITHFSHQQILLRKIKIDLAKAYLNIVLSEDESLPYDFKQGLSLISQVETSLKRVILLQNEYSVRWYSFISTADYETHFSNFQSNIADFRNSVINNKIKIERDATYKITLHITYSNLERKTSEIEALIQGELNMILFKFERVYFYLMWVFVGLILLFSILLVFSINSRDKTREILRMNEQKYRLLFENNPLPMWVYDVQSLKYLTVNEAALNKYGYTREEFLSMTIKDIRPKEEIDRLIKSVKNHVEGVEFAGLWTHIKKDGSSIIVEIISHIIHIDGMKAKLVLANDVTERVKAEQDLVKSENELRKLNEELEHRVTERTSQLTAANNELEAFSYSVSHDLRAPLRGINGFSNILIEEHSHLLDERGKYLCSVIKESAQKMGQLIDDLLTFSRLSRKEIIKSNVDMKSLSNSIYHELTLDTDSSRIQFRVEDIPDCYCDPNMMRLVLSNLIGNAIKFSSKKEKAVISIYSDVNNHEVKYFVKDNGAGFDTKYQHKLFGVFQRLHNINEFEGNGVGLALVQRIIFKHGGDVMATSELNKGAVFGFTIPLHN